MPSSLFCNLALQVDIIDNLQHSAGITYRFNIGINRF